MTITLNCQNCKEDFPLKQHQINKILNPSRRDKGKFCSMNCFLAAYRNQITYNCEMCSKERTVNKHHYSRCKHHFCSKNCSAKFYNSRRTKAYNPSKLERYLQEFLPKLYPSLDLLFNDKSCIGYELDIYIPALKLAFEINGIVHYEPIYGDIELLRIQANDARKIEICKLNGIEIISLDVRGKNNRSKKYYEKFLNIVSNTLNTKLRRQ